MNRLLYYPLARAARRPATPPPCQRVQFPYRGGVTRFLLQTDTRGNCDAAIPVQLHDDHTVHLRLYPGGRLSRISYCEDDATGAEFRLAAGACGCPDWLDQGTCAHVYADVEARAVLMAWVWYEARQRQRQRREARYWTLPSAALREVWI